MRAFDDWARLIVRSWPNPPRPVPFRTVVFRVYGLGSSITIVAAGLLLVVFGLVVMTLPGDRTAVIAIELVVIPLALVFILAPCARSMRTWHALRHGILRTGTVAAVQVFPRGKVRDTIDAYNRGLARGELIVATRGRSLRLEFVSDAPWAASLSDGWVIDVLLDQLETKLLLMLGPRR